jgi:hypothetical protein
MNKLQWMRYSSTLVLKIYPVIERKITLDLYQWQKLFLSANLKMISSPHLS